jgi:protein arginine N-methyltransferase 5
MALETTPVLDFQTYEVFEKDPIKYVTYEEAIREALVDRIPEAEKDTSYQVRE